MDKRFHKPIEQKMIMTAIACTVFLVWGAVNAGVVVLLVWCAVVEKREFLRIAPEDRHVIEEEAKLEGTWNRIDFSEKALTAVSAAMVLVTVVASLFRISASGQPIH
jgi:hypothetical protein